MTLHEIFTTPPWAQLSFIVGWLGTGGLSGCIAGWPRLARRFSNMPVLKGGEQFRFASGFVNAGRLPISFRYCLQLQLNERGMQLAVLWPWRFLHAPFVVPWSEVESITHQRYMFAQHTVVSICGEKSKIRVAGRAGQAVASAYARYRAAAVRRH